MLLATTRGLHHRDPSQRIDPDVEDEAVPVRRDDGVGPAGEARAPEVRPGRLGRIGHRGRCTSSSSSRRSILPAAHELLVERPPGPHVVVLDRRAARASGRSSASSSRSAYARSSSSFVTQSSWPSSDDGSDSSAPSTASQRSSTSVADLLGPHDSRPVSSAYLRASRRNSHCSSIDGAAAERRAVDRRLQRRVVRHRADRGDRRRDREVLVDEAVLDHREHDRGRADLEERRDLAQVRVADDHVQPAVLLRIGVRLVARVDDRALQRGLEPDLLFEEVGALADLVVARVGAVLGADLARAGEDLAGDEPRDAGCARAPRTARCGRRGSSRGSRRSCPCRRCCSCRRRSPGPRASSRRAASIDRARIRSPALSNSVASSGSAHSGVEYSGCAWST